MGTPRFFETHCHLNNPRFAADRAEVLRRARHVGVDAFVIIGYDLKTSQEAAELANPDDGLYAAVGVHPHEVAEWGPRAQAELRDLAARPGVVAIGEIGLDFYRDLAPREAQYPAFEAQLTLARELDLPVVVHTRESVTAALDVIEPHARAGLRALMHCWSGTVEEARRARGLGLLLGVGGVLTYKKPGALAEVVAEVPLESLVLETDSPYLPPVPHRGERNEPGYLPLVARRLAEIRQIGLDAVAAATYATAAAYFQTPGGVGG